MCISNKEYMCIYILITFMFIAKKKCNVILHLQQYSRRLNLLFFIFAEKQPPHETR